MLVSSLPAQYPDSLKTILKNSKADSSIVNACIDLSYSYAHTNLDSAFIYAHKAEARLDKIAPALQCSVYKLLGILSSHKGKDEEALNYFFDQLKIAEEHDLISQSASANICIANVFEELDQHENAINYFTKALADAKKAKDSTQIDGILVSGSDFYFNHKNYNKAFLLWQERLQYHPKLENEERYLSGLGDICKNNEQYDKAETYYLKAIELAQKNNNVSSLIMLYNNFALIPYKKGNIELAIEYCRKAREIAVSIGYTSEENSINSRLANMLFKGGYYEAALPYANDAILFYEANKQSRELQELYTLKSELLFKLSDYKGAYENRIKADKYKEELLNYESQAKLSKLQESIVTEKKNKELAEQKRTRNWWIVTCILIMILALVFLRNFLLNRKQKRIITSQKILLEKKQSEIIESITYAKGVQQATLPSEEFISRNLPDHFIIYLPKDIIAGDFYWCRQVGSLCFIAVADSTGHGVPGALVSIVCSDALSNALRESGSAETGKILDRSRELILEKFSNSGIDVKDGMDISLLCIDQENKKVTWSGANNPLWYVTTNDDPQEKKLVEIKADKQPVGKTEYEKPFTTHQIEYKKGTIFYLFTDGLPDQFGAPKGKKFKYKPFLELLKENSCLPLQEQAAVIKKTFHDWKGELDQVDDVCVIGIRL